MNEAEPGGKRDQLDNSNTPGSLQDAAAIQANERTLLAWIRTGLSLTTFGFVIARLGAWLNALGDPARRIPGAAWIGALFVLMGAMLDAIGISRYALFHRSFMRREPVPTSVAAVVIIAVAIALLGTLLGAFVLYSLREH